MGEGPWRNQGQRCCLHLICWGCHPYLPLPTTGHSIRGFEGLAGGGKNIHLPAVFRWQQERKETSPSSPPAPHKQSARCSNALQLSLEIAATDLPPHISNPGPPPATKHQQRFLLPRPSCLFSMVCSNFRAAAQNQCSECFHPPGRCRDPTPGTAQPCPEAAPG